MIFGVQAGTSTPGRRSSVGGLDLPLKKKELQAPVHEMTVDTPGLAELPPKWVRLATNGTNLGLFHIRFSTFWHILDHEINR